MPFLLDGNPSTSEISDAINYMLSNFSTSYSADPNTGQVTGPDGTIQAYLYKYMAVKYADSFDGTVNFSNLPTNRSYYGIRNSNFAAESSNPTDYIWTLATGGFGVTKFLWFICTGGRQIQFAVATSAPDTGWLIDPGASIDLDVVTSGNIPVIAETFFSYFTPSTLQVPRTGNPLSPVFTNVRPAMFSTDGGIVIPFTDAQTDSSVAFVANTWRIGNSSTTGNGDISYTNITIGAPTDAGDYALWPAPTAMSASPAYITVPVRYKNSLGVVSQASVAITQLVFVDPGAQGTSGPSIDISGYTGFVQNAGGAYTPANTTLTAVINNITSPTYAWVISGGTPTTASTASVVVTPTSSSSGVTVTLTVNGSNLLSPASKTVILPVIYDGAPGQAGANGVMSAFPTIFKWTGNSTPPSRPLTTSTYDWTTGAYTAPTGWDPQAQSNTTPGNYLWSITIPLNVVATVTSSPLDWTDVTNPIRGIAYNGENGSSASVLTLSGTSQTFTYDGTGTPSPTSQTITFTANLQGLAGAPVFTATKYNSAGTNIGSPTLSGSGLNRTLAIGDFDPADYCVVTANLSGYQDTMTIVKLQGGTNGTNGVRTAILDMYKWSASAPTTFPSGTSTYYWATGQFTAPATTNGWELTPPTVVLNQTLWIARTVYADNGTTASTVITWTTTSPSSISASGANGVRTAFLEVYKWSASVPTTFPSGTSSYNWSTGAFTNPSTANGWSVTPGASTPGYILYACSVTYADTNTTSPTSVSWTTSTAYVVGSAGTNGVSPIIGFLTNESVTLAASSSGVVTDFSAAGGTFKMYEGITDVTTSSTFSVVSSSGITISINSVGVYAVSAMSGFTGTATLQAVYGSVTIQKVYSIAKSLAGIEGAPGAATFVITRVANDSSAPTDVEVYALLQRNPVAGDICTVSYNNYNNAVVYRYVTGWALFTTYITGSLIVQNTITADKISTTAVFTNALQVGTSGNLPQISGNTMTGAGTYLYADGRMVTGNATSNLVFDGSSLFLNVPFLQNPQTLTQTVSVASSSNALSVGQTTIANGVEVTVPTGSNWSII